MKRIILSVLAIGLSMGVMAQKFMLPGNAELNKKVAKAKAMTDAKAAQAYHPSIFGDCATLNADSMFYYTTKVQNIDVPITANVLFGGCGQGYSLGSSVQIKGVEFYALNMGGSDVETYNVYVLDQNFNELTSGTYSTADLPTEAFEALTVDFAQPVNTSNFIMAVGFSSLETETQPIVLLPSTEEGCTTGEPFYLNYNGEWKTADEIFESFPAHLFIFPIVEGAVGLSDVELNSLSYVYPNPAKSEVMLASSFKINKCEIVNVLGQLVFTSDVNANSIKVNTSDFAAGNYIVKMYTESGVATKKLVVE